MAFVNKFGYISGSCPCNSSKGGADGGVSTSYVNNNFLRKDGTTPCTGSIDMAGNTLINVSDPVNRQDVVTKNYVNVNFLRGDGTNVMSENLNLGNNNIVHVSNPINPQDAATKYYVDSITTNKVYLKAKVADGEYPSSFQTLTLQEHGHVDWTVFKSISGDYMNFNGSTGVFTAPIAGIYSVSLIARVQGDDLTSTLGNVYFSVNNDTNYAGHSNTVYAMYSSFNPMAWHTFNFGGFLNLAAGDTVTLKSSYGRGEFTIHSSAVMTFARFADA